MGLKTITVIIFLCATVITSLKPYRSTRFAYHSVDIITD